jgi:hypothetical protein
MNSAIRDPSPLEVYGGLARASCAVGTEITKDFRLAPAVIVVLPRRLSSIRSIAVPSLVYMPKGKATASGL